MKISHGEESKRAEKEMIYKLSWAVEQSPSIIILTDKDGKITYVNPKFTRLTGYSPEEAVGKNPFFLNSLEISDEECEQLWQNTISSGEWEGDLNIRKKNGDIYWEAASISPIKNETGTLMGFLKVAEDITVHKLAIEKIAAAMDIKSRFISMVSHELRTPLTSIKEGISIVLDGLTGPVNSDQKDFLDIAKRNVDRLSRLINNVLDFQKLESDKMEFYMGRNDINEVICETQKTMAPLAKEKGVDFIIKLDESLPRVMFDKDKMIQVLMNIIGNAVKFTERGKVIVSTSKRKNLVEVSVRDTGYGIREEDIPKLFHKFEQLTRGKDRRTSGTGLGLAISKDIIEKHRGNLWVESEFGKGTTFHFVLPRRQYDKKILVVDDEPDILRIVTFRLKVLGCEIITAVDGQDAIDMIKRERPDLIFLDLRMPILDGYEVCRFVKTDDISKGTAVILLTASNVDAVTDRTRGFEADDYLIKPFEPEELLGKARKFIGERV